jgi:4-hydroxy-tetrahydrodipicolinate synthase
MLIAGADGGTNATSGVVPELTRAIHRSVQAGQIDEAMRLQFQLLPLFDAMISLGEFPEGFRAGARSRGWNLGPGRVPLSPAQRDAVARTQRDIDALVAEVTELDESLVLPPETIEKIVARVLRQLGADTTA